MNAKKWVSDCLSKNAYDKRLAKKIQAEAYKKRNQPLRIYKCPHCNNYHLTKNVEK